MNDIENKLIKLFQHKSKNPKVQNIINRGFVSAISKPNKILFIGINPSYIPGSLPQSYFYDVSEAVKKYPKHYKNFNELLLNTKHQDKWSYLDLFYFRETDQNKINLIIQNDISFIVNQLRLTNEIIKDINPNIIVVANSKASNFFGINKFIDKKGEYINIWYGLDFKFDEKTGLMKVIGINKNSILEYDDFNFFKNKLFLFTSTLTYMNRFDKNRLKWLIERI